MLFILILQICKLRPGFGQGAASLLPEDEDGESRLSDLGWFFFSVFVGVLVDFLIRWGSFPLCFCFAVSVGDQKFCLWLLLFTVSKLKGFGYVC